MATRFIIGFGYEIERDMLRNTLTTSDVAAIIDALAREARVPAYSLRFGPGSWRDQSGGYVTERGATVEVVDCVEATPRMRRFAADIRDALRQQCVVYYEQPVQNFEFI